MSNIEVALLADVYQQSCIATSQWSLSHQTSTFNDSARMAEAFTQCWYGGRIPAKKSLSYACT